MTSVREAVLLSLLKQDKEGTYSNMELKETLRQHDYSPADRAFFKQLFYGVLEKRIYLDYYIKRYSSVKLAKMSPKVLFILRLGLYQLLFLDKVPESAACNESVKLAKRYAASAGGFVNGVLRSVIRGGKTVDLPDKGGDPVSYLSVAYSVNTGIADLLLSQYGFETTESMLKALSEPPAVYARINSLKTTPQEFAMLAGESRIEVPEYDGYTAQLRITGDLERNPLYRKGLFHLQGRASQLCCLALAPAGGHTVLDVCSAPGGKAFTIAQMMDNQGSIHAFELHEHRTKLIQNGANRLGITAISVNHADSAKPLDIPLASADRILCDVPCSALGILNKKPELRYKRLDEISSLIELQYSILQNASRYLKPGGLLVYSTCTLDREENERLTNRFLEENSDFRYGALPSGLSDRAGAARHGGYVTLMPHTDRTDGFFIAVLERKNR